MPIYTVQGPDGRTYEIEGPEGATAEQLGRVIMSAQQKPPEKTYDPTDGMSTFDKFAAGAGKAVVDLGRGVAQLANPALDFVAPRKPGLRDLVLGTKPESRVEEGRREVAEARQRDAALMNTGSGAAGNFAGNVAMLAPTAMIPGAATIPGAAIVGGVTGAAQPSTSTGETLANIGLGSAGGAAGQFVANKLPAAVNAWSQNAKQKAAEAAAANAQKFAAAQQGNKLGYVIPPADLNPGMVSEAVSGLSGKIKTAQVASQRNQTVTDKLARRALGLADDAELSADVLNGIRRQASAAYDGVKSVGTIQADKQFFDALDQIAATQQGAGRSFPGLQNNGVVDLVASLKQQAFEAGDAVDATKVLREMADAAYRAGDKAKGKAAKSAADALEEVLDRNLQAAGNPKALQEFRDARQLIAKTYTVQKALNTETGAVNAQVLAKELGKGKPLSGELKDVAKVATAFPKATQALKEAPKAISPLDFAVATATGASTMNPLSVLMLGARPAARTALLSSPVQRAALNPGYQASMAARFAPAAIDNQLFKLLAAPVGMTAAYGQQQ